MLHATCEGTTTTRTGKYPRPPFAEQRQAIPGDLRDEIFCRHLLEGAVKQLGGLDILVSNAGRQQAHASILEISTEEFDWTIKTNPDLYDYAQTKAATMNFVKSLTKHLAPKGIRVNGVAPGPIWTPLQISGGASVEKQTSFGHTPLGRPGMRIGS